MIHKLLGIVAISILASAASRAAASDSGFHPCSFPKGAGVDASVDAFCWYPAKESTGTAMAVGDYVRAALPSQSPGVEDVRAALRPVVDLPGGAKLDDDAIDELLARPVPPRRNAVAIATRHPVAIVSGGLDTPPYMLSSVCERLAENGFLVIALSNPARREGDGYGFNGASLERLVERVRLVIRSLPELSNADPDRVALVGWSFGGVVNAAVALEQPSIDALVSLDCGVGYDYGWNLIRNRSGFDGKRSIPPVLEIRALGTTGVPRADDFFALTKRGLSSQLDLEGLHHRDLATPYGEWRESTPKPEIRTAHREVVSFLQRVFRAPDAASTAR